MVELKSTFLSEKQVTIFVKREDLNHPTISGNKWWKLKYNIQEAIKGAHSTLLTFGGAYSNHIYATAAAANESELHSIGIIRGEEPQPLNPTLTFAKSKGMKLSFVSREDYRLKMKDGFIQSLKNEYGRFYLIPEGGTNHPAIKGCEEWAQQLKEQIEFDFLCLPVGTGGTISGMINVLTDKNIVGFSSLKGGQFLNKDIKKWITKEKGHWRIETAYHFGGYGKVNKQLIEFMSGFESQYNIPLDQVYTAKMMFGIFDLIEKNAFKAGSKILVLHTGGLQGKAGLTSDHTPQS